MRLRRNLVFSLLAAAAACTDPPTPAPGAAAGEASERSQGSDKAADAHEASPEPTAAPSKPAVPPQPPVPTAEPALVTEVATGFNDFGLDLYRHVSDPPGNLIISPASVSLALTMTHAGARSATAKEMAETLRFPRAAPLVQRAVATMLTQYAKPGENTTISIANRLFGDDTLTYQPPFLSLSNRYFRAPLEPTDFKNAPEPARARINSWVSEKTRDRINDLLPSGSITAATRLVLVNAIFFKAPWAQEFSESRTAAAPFFSGPEPHDVPTMYMTESVKITEADGTRVVELPYQDPRFSMVIVMPTGKADLGALEASLNAERLNTWNDTLRSERVELALPKFKIAPQEPIRLASVLQEMGMKLAFSGDADFSGMAPKEAEIQLSEAFHKGFIEVDEKGTEAAAATAIVARAGSAAPTEPPREVRIDHPFMFMVRDTHSGLLLFVGRVDDPAAQ